MEFTKVGTQAMTALGIGAALSFILPIALALIWKFRKKEKFTSILAGAATFLVFAVILEKPLQNVLLFPTQIGLQGHAFSSFLNARPVLLAFLTGLFPGVFEETGRLVAYKTVLKNRTNRETGISHGIGHGGFEMILLQGVSFVTYIAYALMINSGSFGTLIEQAPGQADAMYGLAEQIAALTVTDIWLGMAERVFAVLFHIGASILVFYACRDREKFWLYPLAVVLHTALDFFSALYAFGIGNISILAVEAALAALGILTFCGGYFLLYRKDRQGKALSA